MGANERIAALAAAVADGAEVDWAAAESTAPTEWERAVIRRLARIGRIAEYQRRPTATASPDPAPTIGAAGETASTWHWGDLAVLARIGQGAFGEVYRAHDPRVSRDVALKLLRREVSSAGFAVVEEGRLLARV